MGLVICSEHFESILDYLVIYLEFVDLTMDGSREAGVEGLRPSVCPKKRRRKREGGKEEGMEKSRRKYAYIQWLFMTKLTQIVYTMLQKFINFPGRSRHPLRPPPRTFANSVAAHGFNILKPEGFIILMVFQSWVHLNFSHFYFSHRQKSQTNWSVFCSIK